jgi:hypothetical protein
MFDPISASIITGLVISIISGAVLAWQKRRWEIQDIKRTTKTEETEKFDERIKKIEEMASSIQKAIWRLNKISIIQAKILDDQTEKLHPELASSLEDITSELLKESDNS